METTPKLTPQQFVSQIFVSEGKPTRAVAQGGVAHRAVASVTFYQAGEELIKQVKERGYRLLRAGDAWVIVCNKDFDIVI